MNHFPVGWVSYDSYVRAFGFDGYRLPCKIADVNRFGARFRVAASFREIILDGYGCDTSAGYSALCKVFFAWSAFEAFMKVFSVAQSEAADMINSYEPVVVASRIRSLDVKDSFYGFVYERVNKKHKKELENYFTSNPCNVLYLASAIRHLFAHGVLTPNVDGVPPSRVCEICDALYGFLILVMNGEFGKHTENMNNIFSKQR